MRSVMVFPHVLGVVSGILTLTLKGQVFKLQTLHLVINMKICNSCGLEKTYESFYRDSSKKDGYRTTCKECKSLCDKNYRVTNAESISVKRRQKYLRDYEKERSQQSVYAKNNRELLNKHNRAYKQRNKGTVNFSTRLRQARKLKATPAWADLEQIKRVYTTCAKISERTGVEHHVDHIIPLQGKNVCGLHVEKNLAIIPAKMNLEKGNSFSPWSSQ